MKNNFLLIILVLSFGLFSCEKDATESDENNQQANNSLNGKSTAIFNTNLNYGSMTDQDGNTYRTVTIGTQIWMAENLRSTIYNDGTAIPNVTDNTAWINLTTDAYCNINNTSNADTIATYGRLYNWYAVNTGKLAPAGWHVPTDVEWTTLINYLGGNEVAGGKLKETNTTHWINPNLGATNITGFTALPGAERYHRDGSFDPIGHAGFWWSSSELNTDFAVSRMMVYYEDFVYNANDIKQRGYSVRLVKD